MVPLKTLIGFSVHLNAVSFHEAPFWSPSTVKMFNSERSTVFATGSSICGLLLYVGWTIFY